MSRPASWRGAILTRTPSLMSTRQTLFRGEFTGGGERYDAVAAPPIKWLIDQKTIEIGAGEGRFLNLAQPPGELLKLVHAGSGVCSGGLVSTAAGVGGGRGFETNERLDVVRAQAGWHRPHGTRGSRAGTGKRARA